MSKMYSVTLLILVAEFCDKSTDHALLCVNTNPNYGPLQDRCLAVAWQMTSTSTAKKVALKLWLKCTITHETPELEIHLHSHPKAMVSMSPSKNLPNPLLESGKACSLRKKIRNQENNAGISWKALKEMRHLRNVPLIIHDIRKAWDHFTVIFC